MNKHRIKKLRDRISACEYHPSYAPIASKSCFNMRSVWFRPPVLHSLSDETKDGLRLHHRCDSPACLIGHTLDLFGDLETVKKGAEAFGKEANMAKDALDINERAADSLFYPANMDKLDVQDALDTLDNFLVTGNVDWPTKEPAK